ncbi:hypothetical protein [Kitasatospora sp. CB01950]|uniref:hypothetical protein n=1 Tax=Kitasatospora sp. CB01950 TaxID=1703930 RepID=UPI00093F1A03|nr:hypothetical protein [Kitasatospora sp. CB01950]OKI97210.1 hypothetical protein AMK19_32375 [Kitasatospora sp. CB01950]
MVRIAVGAAPVGALARPPDSAPHVVDGLVLVVLGVLAVALGILWAADYRAMVSSRRARHEASRAQRRPALPPPPGPAVQRLTGVLLALTGCAFVLTGVRALVS